MYEPERSPSNLEKLAPRGSDSTIFHTPVGPRMGEGSQFIGENESFRTANYAENSMHDPNSQNRMTLPADQSPNKNSKDYQRLQIGSQMSRNSNESDSPRDGGAYKSKLGNHSKKVKCPNCQVEAYTEVSHKLRTGGRFCCIMLSLTIILIPCACIVMNSKSFLNVQHECPNCGYMLIKQKYNKKDPS